MKTILIAKTAIAEATRGYDREYDYLIPEQFAERAKTGCRALVPFGKRNALRHAIILSVYTKPKDIESRRSVYDCGCVSGSDGDGGGSTGDGGDGCGGDSGGNCVDIGDSGGNCADSGDSRSSSVDCGDGDCRAAGAGTGLKPLADIPDEPPALLEKDIELAARMREKYNCTWFNAFSCMLPAGWKRIKKPREKSEPVNKKASKQTDTGKDAVYKGSRNGFELTDEQEKALLGLVETLDRREYAEALLYGVTGSGKTEVYMRLIDRVVARGRQAIVLVPEISLTPQMMRRFVDFFGDRIAIFHSKLSASVRERQWRLVKSGGVQIALGARSAVFAPFDNLGAIIIDEEHEPSYKSDMTPRYHTSDIARMRCESYGALLLYGSATPSVELYYRAARGDCGLFALHGRTNRKPLPKVSVVDMREELKNGNRRIFSRALSLAMSDELSEHRQIILFLNRRGYSSFLLCRSCGYIVSCRNCSVSYTYHIENDRLICHYCGLTAPPPSRCPVCRSAEIGGFGAGTEKIEREVRQLFPGRRALRLDRDTAAGKDAYEKILGAFRDGEADILIGTQMIAKGHDFPNVTLVGVLEADMILNFSDYRATERTFQLLTQVAGRSGRGEVAGRVVIQTYNPDHFSVSSAREHDYIGFYRQEMLARRELRYPPFMNIGVFLLSGPDDAKVGESAMWLKQAMEHDSAEGLDIIGPARPVHAKIKERYRWRIIIKHKYINTMEAVARSAADVFYKQKNFSGVDLMFDINPFSML